MTEISADSLEEFLKGVEPPAPIVEPSVEEQQLQQQGNNPNALSDEDNRIRRLRNDRFSDENEHWKKIYELRAQYIPYLFFMVVGWLIFAAATVILTGVGLLTISDAVLIALVTTTTATVLGIFIIVAKWLFPSPYKSDSVEK